MTTAYLAVITRVKQPHDYINRWNSLSIKRGLISSPILVPSLLRNRPDAKAGSEVPGPRPIIAADRDRKPLFDDFGVC